MALPYQHDIENYITGGARNAVVGGEMIASQLPGRTDGFADAYRHLLIAGELTRVYGEPHLITIGGVYPVTFSGSLAEFYLTFHELDSIFGGGSSNTNMDTHNNAIGIEIGNYVREHGGNFNDVVNLARTVMAASLQGYDFDDIDEQWVAGEGGILTHPENFPITVTVY